MNNERDYEHGELAFTVRFQAYPAAAPAWKDLEDSARAVWRRIEDAITERAVNQRHRLQVEVVEAVEERCAPAYEAPRGSAHLGESFGYHRGRVRATMEAFLDGLEESGPILGDHQPELRITLSDEARPVLDRMVEALEQDIPRPAPAPAMPKLSGNACPKCKNFTMVRTGKCETCQTCGDAGECS